MPGAFFKLTDALFKSLSAFLKLTTALFNKRGCTSKKITTSINFPKSSRRFSFGHIKVRFVFSEMPGAFFKRTDALLKSAGTLLKHTTALFNKRGCAAFPK
jgi:hypothetical protein